MDFLILSDIHSSWIHLEKMISMAEGFDGLVFLGDLVKRGSNRVVVSTDIKNFTKIYDAAKFTVGVPGNGAIPELVEYLDDLGISVHGKSYTRDDIGFFGAGGTPDPVTLIMEIREFFKNEVRPVIELQPITIETLAVFGVSIKNDVFFVEDWTEIEERELENYRGHFDHSEGDIYDILNEGFRSLSESSIRVLLSHVPPYVPIMNPKFPEGVSAGSKGITKFIKKFRPSVVLSGHYHISHESEIDGVPCYIIPAVTDGFYSILNIEEDSKECKITVNRFSEP